MREAARLGHAGEPPALVRPSRSAASNAMAIDPEREADQDRRQGCHMCTSDNRGWRLIVPRSGRRCPVIRTSEFINDPFCWIGRFTEDDGDLRR